MKKTSKKGFTLMEMLIVIAIIAILIAIAIPVFTAQLNKASLATDQSNARSLKSMVVTNYMSYVDDPSNAKSVVKGGTAGKFYLSADGNSIQTSTSGAMECKGNDTTNYQTGTDKGYVYVQWDGSAVTSSNPKLPG